MRPISDWIAITIVGLLALAVGVSTAHAEAAIPEDKAVKAILGEAGGCAYSEKLAIASALKNRNSLRGVYGYHSKTHYSDDVVQQVYKAWAEAGEHDVTHGATNWLSRSDLKCCRPSLIAWRFRMVKTLETDNFVFYKNK